MTPPGFTAEVSLYEPAGHYVSGSYALPRQTSLQPAQIDLVRDRSVDVNRRSASATYPPLCQALPPGLYEACLIQASFDCVVECQGRPDRIQCEAFCRDVRGRWCERLKEICLPLPPPRKAPTGLPESAFYDK
jgi:hypothetical protein